GKAKGAAADVRAAAPKPAQRATDQIEVPGFNGGAGPRLCFMGWRGPGAADADAPALELLASCLGGGSAARLPALLVQDEGLALTAQAGFSAQRDGSLLWAFAVVPPGADSAAVERTLLDAAKSLSRR